MIGTTLSHYKILEKLGTGGMGEVYRAEDTTLKRQIALKVLPPDLAASQERLERFQREAEILAALDHPNIVGIHTVEEAEGVRFLTMQLVDGKRLSDLISKGGMPLERIFEIAVPLTDALAAAHEKGVIHRDLKPGNIMVTEDGRVKVLDFGLAKLGEVPVRQEAMELPTEPLTNEGRILGTVPYMSPEQLEGKPVDARSDIFSLGVILYELAVGERPFKGDSSASFISSILRDTPSDIGTLRTDLPHHLARVIRRCLEKKAQRRYQSALDVRNELEDLKREVVSGEGPTAVTLPAAAAWPRGRRVRLALVATLVVAATAVGLYVARIREPAGVETGPEAIRSLAVLPLANLMNDPEQEYFVDGMTEALIAELAKMDQLKVISRTSIMQYKGAKKPLPDIAQELDVDALVEGSVLRSGDEVRITAQLIDGTTDEHLWVGTYDRNLEDMLAVHREVARAIAREINIRLTPEQHERLSPLGPVDPAAYEAYLKGRYYWNQRTETALRKGLEYFEQAIELDPRYAPAYAGIADSYTLLAWIGAVPPHEAMPKAKAAARQALEIDDSLAEAHTSMGMVKQVYEWDWPGAEKEHRRALELNPGYATARAAYATLLSALGRPEGAVAERRRAQRLDPLSPILAVGVGLDLYLAGRYEEAIAEAGSALELAPAFFPGHFAVGAAHLQSGMHEQAITHLDTARNGSGGSTLTVAALAHGHAVSGQQAQAEELLEGLLERSEQEYVSAYFIAWIYLGLGHHERALDWLEKAHEEHSTWFFLIKVDPILDPLRHRPRFQQLVRRMSFPE